MPACWTWSAGVTDCAAGCAGAGWHANALEPVPEPVRVVATTGLPTSITTVAGLAPLVAELTVPSVAASMSLTAAGDRRSSVARQPCCHNSVIRAQDGAADDPAPGASAPYAHVRAAVACVDSRRASPTSNTAGSATPARSAAPSGPPRASRSRAVRRRPTSCARARRCRSGAAAASRYCRPRERSLVDP